jgi:hypothetical protein
MRIQPRELLVGDDDYVAARADGTATIGGVDHSWSTIGLYRVHLSGARSGPGSLTSGDRGSDMISTCRCCCT